MRTFCTIRSEVARVIRRRSAGWNEFAGEGLTPAADI